MVSTSSIKAKVIAYCRDWLVGQLPQHNLDPALMNSDSAVRRAGYVLAFVLVFGFGTWAGCAPLESAAYATGKVEVEGSSKIIQHFEGVLSQRSLWQMVTTSRHSNRSYSSM